MGGEDQCDMMFVIVQETLLR